MKIVEIIEKLKLEINISEIDMLARNSDDTTVILIEDLYKCLKSRNLIDKEDEEEKYLPKYTQNRKMISFAEENEEVKEVKTSKSEIKGILSGSPGVLNQRKVQKPIPQSLSSSLLHQIKVE